MLPRRKGQRDPVPGEPEMRQEETRRKDGILTMQGGRHSAGRGRQGRVEPLAILDSPLGS